MRLQLFVAGRSPGAVRALAHRERLLQAATGSLVIEVIDIVEHPEVAETARILATPTLSDQSTTPPRRLVGDLAELDQVLAFFGLTKRSSTP